MFGFESLSFWFEYVKAFHQNQSSSSKNEESDSNPLWEDSNPISKKFKLKKVIRILQKRIQSQFQNVQTKESEDNDSNLYGEDSNPDSSKVCSDGWIRISIQDIRILGEEKNETEGQKFKSLKFGFEFLMKNKWRDWS